MSYRSALRTAPLITISEYVPPALVLGSPIRPSLKRRRASSESAKRFSDRDSFNINAIRPHASDPNLAGRTEDHPLLHSGSMHRASVVDSNQVDESRQGSIGDVRGAKRRYVGRLFSWLKNVISPRRYRKLG